MATKKLLREPLTTLFPAVALIGVGVAIATVMTDDPAAISADAPAVLGAVTRSWRAP